MRNFDMTSVPVRTVDADSLSEIAIHNFEEVEKLKFVLSTMDRVEGDT